VVGRAAGVEGRAAVRAGVVARQVARGAHRTTAGPAQHGGLAETLAGPRDR
jgi:hypothetical protein